MDIHASFTSSLIGSISLILIYIYLYLLYRERFMGIWAVSWLIILVRFILFDSNLLNWKTSLIGLATYQLLLFISCLTFIWGTHLFINKPLNKGWIYSTMILCSLSITLGCMGMPLLYQLLFPILFASVVCIWIGLKFIYHLELQGMGHLITGYAFILWSLLLLSTPFIMLESNLPCWTHAIGGILRLTIGIGTLMVYFEKSRTDLSNKETHYRLLAENAIDIIYQHQLLPEATIKYITPSALTITGYTPEEYYQDNNLIFKLIHPDDYPLLKDFLYNMPHSLLTPLTLRLIRKDKTVLWIEQKCSALFDEKQNLIAIEGIIRDITERKKLEQMAALFDQMNMVGSMAATVAHEIRNPMTTVRGYLQFMGRKNEYQKDHTKFELMIGEIDRANSIIQEYLSLSRRKVVALTHCSLTTIIETLFPLIQADATGSKIYASLDLAPVPYLLLDENEIRQLLLNLVRNSIEAMPRGGNLKIYTFSEEDTVVLGISDEGSGISPQILEQLGKPFVTTKDTGTGLGIPICYQIAHRHQATIKIDTSTHGTTFFIYFKQLAS